MFVRKLAVLLVVVLSLFAGTMQRESGFAWWTTHSLVKVRPHDLPPDEPGRAVELFAARNEFEPFQIVVRAENADLEGLDVQISEFSGPAGAASPRFHTMVYLERFIHLRQPSSKEGETGEWPDALVPRVDQYRKSKRNAFPFKVKQGRNQPVWVEVYVPEGTPPGKYTAQAKITSSGHAVVQIPVTLNVWNFDLPSTSTLRTAFGLNGTAALKQHYGSYTSDDDLHEITAVYMRAALLHRISVYGGTFLGPPASRKGDGLRLDWTAYDREMGPLLNGTALPAEGPLPGARATSADLRVHSSADSDEKKVLYWREWVRHFQEKGWLDRLYYYVWDEPPPGAYPKVAERARLARKADPGLRNLVTASYHEQLAGVIDVWTPLINCLADKPGFDPFCQKTVGFEAYKAELKQGKNLWWYQSCASHGCGGVGGEYFRGWPSYMIDASPVSNRILQWLAWKYRIQGELYFSMNEAYGRDKDPWNDVWMHSGNGDGTLFYPGRPSQIGGDGHIPVESIRLKLIREGLEDYEYLALLGRRRMEAFADQTSAKIVDKLYKWSREPQALFAARRALGEKLSRHPGPAETSGRPAAADSFRARE